ncbi:recombinase family protein [Sutcliffiella horikoshii]|uniref:Recombinase family protein n=1 Tax=Sutcliffiella horikoshii TaxID=79883 RepID=A0A5D4T2Y4_9BACI|nr:recombinase family protein [Sutcliffiella horikoshii]TYS69745.1 recombinase family protein [Sutcliffiella horikoshii]
MSGQSSSRVRIIPAKARTGRTEANPDGQKKRIAVYARVSTDSEMQASSYDLQVAHYTEYVSKNPSWILADVYADEGISGTSTKNRTEFNRMIQDCEEGRIDYILTKSISRFARNTLDCISVIRKLKGRKNPIGVYFEKENIDTLDSKSELFLTILSSMAQEESRSVSENTKWGVQKRFQQGIVHMPTTFFLGYDTTEDGEIIIDEEQAEVVRRIFREFLEGKGCPRIAKGLTRDGLKTGKGNKTWTSDAVYKILKQEKYQGHCLAQKTVTIDYLTHKRVRNRDIQPQYFVKNTHPAIISEETFEAVQQEIKRRSLMMRDPDNKYRQHFSGHSPFSNQYFCGECGRPVIRRRLTSSRKGEKYYISAWQCRVTAGRDPDYKNCKTSYVHETDLENAFMKIMGEMKYNIDDVIEEAKQAIEKASLSPPEQQRLEELNTQIEAITDRITDLAAKESATRDAIYDATLRHLIYEQEILQQERDSLEENMQEQLYLEKQLQSLLDLLEITEELEDFDVSLFKKLIERGIIYKERIVEFQFKCGVKRTLCVRERKTPKKK